MHLTPDILHRYGFVKDESYQQTGLQRVYLEKWCYKNIVALVNKKNEHYTFYLSEKGNMALGILLWNEKDLKRVIKELENRNTTASLHERITANHEDNQLKREALQKLISNHLN